jgi:hypothetical protein
MSLPTLSKTWQFNVNNQYISSGNALTDNQAIAIIIKNAFLSVGSSPWVVAGSSNGVTAGMDSVDRWNTTADIVTGSWIVLKQAGIHSNFYITLEPAAGAFYNFRVWAQNGAPTGGSISAIPTHATTWDANFYNPGAATYLFANLSTGNYDLAWHYMQSTDGQCTRLVFTNLLAPKNLLGYWSFEKPKNPKPYWTLPVIANRGFGGGFDSIYQVLNGGSVAGAGVSTMLSGARVTLGSSGEGGFGLNILAGDAGHPFSSNPNDLDGSWFLSACGMGTIYAPYRGKHGDYFDLWLSPNSLSTGDTFPLSGTKQFIVFGNFLFPWNGSTPVLI